MTTKRWKQIIIPMGRNNVDKIMASSSNHVTNINRTLKNIKSNIMVDYIWPKAIGVVIVTNSVMVALDLQVIENYVIIEILYLMENTNTPITLKFIEAIIKLNYIFNDLSLTSKPRVIKASLKSNIAII